MHINMYETVEALPSAKRDRGPGPSEAIKAFVQDPDKKAMIISCDTVEEAHTVNVSARAIIKKQQLPINVWRAKQDVCFEKEEDI